MTCPSAPPTTPPTIGSDPYLGATITTYDADGRAIQVTNPLGGITLTSYDPAGNVIQTTVESNNSTSDPNVVTDYTYDADNQPASTTVDPGGSLAATTEESYDPDGNVFCSVSANAVASGSLPVPPLAGRLDRRPAQSRLAVLDHARPRPRPTRSPPPSTTPTANRCSRTNPDVQTTDQRRRRRRAHLLQLRSHQRFGLADRQPVGHLPLFVPDHPAVHAPGPGLQPRLRDHHLRRRRAHPVLDRPGGRHHQSTPTPRPARLSPPPTPAARSPPTATTTRTAPASAPTRPPPVAARPTTCTRPPPRPPPPTPPGEATTDTYYPGGQPTPPPTRPAPPPTPTTPTAT